MGAGGRGAARGGRSASRGGGGGGLFAKIPLVTADEGREEVWQGRLETRVVEHLGRFLTHPTGRFPHLQNVPERL